ncbi:unnamed protein product [Adineta steineri]|uniref:Uncharacterized protein n=1 Tax=Adineta steineri TaxID=433720 RepID=A0A814XQG8_9BILA|nr:unnamed protein product [Adineta steineri]
MPYFNVNVNSIFVLGFDEYRCKDYHIQNTLYKPTIKSDISCPQNGVYKSLNTYRSSLPISTCSTGLWTLSIGCERTNASELKLSSSCYHDIVPDVQVITSVKGTCLASWRTDHRFQRTLVLYDKTKAFCLIQPLKSMTASWILSESSCTNIGLLSIHVENSLRYSHMCQQNIRSLFSSSSLSVKQLPCFLFYILMQVLINVNVMK